MPMCFIQHKCYWGRPKRSALSSSSSLPPLISTAYNKYTMIFSLNWWGTHRPHRPPFGSPAADRPTRQPPRFGSTKGGGRPHPPLPWGGVPPPPSTRDCRGGGGLCAGCRSGQVGRHKVGHCNYMCSCVVVCVLARWAPSLSHEKYWVRVVSATCVIWYVLCTDTPLCKHCDQCSRSCTLLYHPTFCLGDC